MTEVSLRQPVRVRLDLSQIPLHSEFTVDTSVFARADDRRRGEAYMKARLRDPVNTGGVAVEFTGLTPTNRPVLSPFIAAPPPEPQCTNASDPEAGVIQFSSATGLIHEFGAIAPPVYITRTGGSRGTIVATVRAADDSAIAGTHYSAFNESYVFGDGDDVPRAIRLAPIDNNTADGDVVVTLSLTAPSGCPRVGDVDEAEITIVDDEARPTDVNYSVGGTVSGLSGTGLVLEEAVTGMRVTPSNGAFTFNYAYQDGSNYNVRIVTQPTNPIQSCTVANASGAIASASVTSVAVTCTTPLPNGSLDPTFGASGKVTAALAGGAVAVGLQNNGKILVLGERALLRYAADGTVDTSFGTNGQVNVGFTGGSFDVIRDMAVLPDDKIIVVGYGRSGSQDDFAAARYNADGTTDYTFGSAGKAYVDFNGLTDRAHDVDVQSDGSIVLSGHAGVTSTAGPSNDFAVARLTASGGLDTTFSSDGRATVNIAGATDLGAAAALQADGAIVVVGRVGVSGGATPDVGAVRFTATGDLDAAFGAAGIVRIDYGSTGWDEATDVAVQSDGKIVIAGHVTLTTTSDYLIARLNVNGTRDTAFGTNGMTTLAFGALQDAASALAIQPDGGILVVGVASSSTVADMGIARYLNNGSLDTAFGGTGTLSIDFFGAADDAKALVIQPDGKVIVAGEARNGTSNELGLIRVTP